MFCNRNLRLVFLYQIAVSGHVTGECYRNLKAHPGTGKSIIGYSIVGGILLPLLFSYFAFRYRRIFYILSHLTF